MLIAGGRPSVKYLKQSEPYHKTIDIVLQDGKKCQSHDIPELAKELEGFGMTSKNDRFVYVCGGQHRLKNGADCFTNCGNYFSFSLFFS